MKCGVPVLRLRRERVLLIAADRLGSRARAERWLTSAEEGRAPPAERLTTLEDFLGVLEEAGALEP